MYNVLANLPIETGAVCDIVVIAKADGKHRRRMLEFAQQLAARLGLRVVEIDVLVP